MPDVADTVALSFGYPGDGYACVVIPTSGRFCRACQRSRTVRIMLINNDSRRRMTLDCRKNTPVDHARTTRQHAGEALKNGANAPGLAGAAVAVIALTVGLFAVAAGHPGGRRHRSDRGRRTWRAQRGVAAACPRKARDAELRWHASHSERPAPPPSS